MNIYDYLKIEHNNVKALFKLFEKTQDNRQQTELVTLIIRELSIHAHAEQESFYKKLLEFPATKAMASHAKKEHAEIEAQIKIVKNSLTAKEWVHAVYQLEKIVAHHVKEEEGEIFRKAREVLSESEAYILKDKMHYLKGKYLSEWDNPQVKITSGTQKHHLVTPKKSGPSVSAHH